MLKIIAPDFNGQLEPLELGAVVDDKKQLQIVITAGTVSVYTNAGTLVVNAQPVIISADNQIGYAFSVPENAILTNGLPNINCYAKWSLTDGVTTYERITFFSISKIKIRTGLTDDGLISLFPELEKKRNKNAKGLAQNGSTTTVINDTSRTEPSGYFVGGKLGFVTGANNAQSRTITNYNNITGQITVSPAFPYAPDPKDQYIISDSFSPQRLESLYQILRRINQALDDNDVLNIQDGFDITDIHQYLTIVLICENQIQAKDDQFDLAARRFRGYFEEGFQQLKLKISTSVTGDLPHKKPLRRWVK